MMITGTTKGAHLTRFARRGHADWLRLKRLKWEEAADGVGGGVAAGPRLGKHQGFAC